MKKELGYFCPLRAPQDKTGSMNESYWEADWGSTIRKNLMTARPGLK